MILNQSFAVKFSQIYTKGKTTIHQFITDEKPEFVSLALDGWSQHHHGYIGSIADMQKIFSGAEISGILI